MGRADRQPGTRAASTSKRPRWRWTQSWALLGTVCGLLPLAWASSVCCDQITVQAPATVPTTPRPVVLKAARLLDVRTGKLQSDQAILIEGERIKAVGPAVTLQAQAGAAARVIDLGNVTMLPGLIDTHTHLTYGLNIGHPESLAMSVPREALQGARHARQTLLAGFTSVRNLGARGYSDVALRDAIDAGDVIGPRMVVSGPAIGSTGGHMDCGMLSPEFAFRAEGVADGKDAVMRKTREVIKYGADVVKVAVTGGVLSKGTSVGNGQYSDEELVALVQEAHRLGRKVAAHAHGAEGLKQALRAQVDSIEHGSLIDEQGIKLLKQRGAYLVPTLYAAEWLIENATPQMAQPDMIQKAREMLPIARQNLGRALQAGVKVAFGTDSSVYPHGLNAREFAVMVKLGFSPLQAIQAATISAADLLGWNDRVGQLQPSYYADVIAVAGDPLTDVTVLENVAFVMKGGQVVKDEHP
jgi:imidazolonepropionase-like amidohydrolase